MCVGFFGQSLQRTSTGLGSMPRLDWIGTVLTVAIFGILVAPWPSQSPEVRITEFVPSMMTADPRGNLRREGQVRVTSHETLLLAAPESQPTVHWVTAEVPFDTEFSVTVLNRDPGHVFPFQAKVWNPRAEAAVEVWYGPDGAVMAGIRVGNDWRRTARVGSYNVGHAKRWRIVTSVRRVAFEVWGAGERAVFEVDKEAFPLLFEQEAFSLTVYASAPMQASSVTSVRDPIIVVPTQTKYGSTVRSSSFRLLTALLGFASIAWLLTRPRLRLPHSGQRVADWAVMLILTAVSLAVGWLISALPGHPYDVRGALLWSSIAREQGPAAIAGYSLVATAGHAYGGVPFAPVTYQYPPLLTYIFLLAGKVVPPILAERTLKMLAMLAVVGTGGIIFSLLRRLGVNLPLRTLATAAYILNPAILFDSAVWGQSDAFVALFLVVGAAGVALGSPPLLWTGTLLAALTKQTGILFGIPIVILGVARLGIRESVRGIPTAMVIAFLTLVPLFLWGMHPSAVYRPILAVTRGFAVDGANVNAVVSHGAFTLWSGIAILEGARGWERLALPDADSNLLGISYFALSRFAFGFFTGFLALVIFRKSKRSPESILLAMAAYGAGVVLLITRVSPRYTYFGLMFAAASLPWISPWLWVATLIALTSTMLVSMWGVLASVSVWYPGVLPAFDPERFWLNSVMASAIGSDTGITIGSILNTAALLGLFAALWMRGREGAARASGAPVGDQ